MYYAVQNSVLEFSLCSEKFYEDPFNEVELDVVFEGPSGSKRVVPAFWTGENLWKVRFSAPDIGRYLYTTICSDKENLSLHNQKGEIEVSPYQGKNPLLIHGPLRVDKNHHYLEHIDGTPFFWLADTWWMGLCKRLTWPEDFQVLTQDRVTKGFTVIQIVAGLYPDMPPFDERGANEAGFPWGKDYTRINPAYFDMVDLRIGHLVHSGLLPCIVGCWGYFLPWMGIEKMKKHWRYLIARYGVYPVVWCLAGEGIMPYYLSTDKEKDIDIQKKGWTEITRYVRQLNSYHHPVTIHSVGWGNDLRELISLVDFDMPQTGHSDRDTVPNHVNTVVESVKRRPPLPVLVGEVCYEGILGASWENIQRFMFWSSILSGACGHTYGANGIWQVNTHQKPFGPSPHGRSWGDMAWEDAYRLPGSIQMGIAKRLLEHYPWWKLKSHPEWVEPHWNSKNYLACYAAGIPGELRVIFIPVQVGVDSIIRGLEPEVTYRAFYYDPRNGREYPLGIVKPNIKGEWTTPLFPIFQDRILVLEKEKSIRR